MILQSEEKGQKGFNLLWVLYLNEKFPESGAIAGGRIIYA